MLKMIPAGALDAVKYDSNGLVPAIAQDAQNGDVLMMAYMNRESLEATLTTGKMTYWSRSRRELWVKGASSGHEQEVVECRLDCDGDALLFRILQKGGACHTGYRSCFFRRMADAGWTETGTRVFDPEQVYTS